MWPVTELRTRIVMGISSLLCYLCVYMSECIQGILLALSLYIYINYIYVMQLYTNSWTHIYIISIALFSFHSYSLIM